MKFKPAIKFESFLKMGLSGPPGSGKSYTALVLASFLSSKRVAVIDADGGSSSKYAHRFTFDMNDITIDEKVNKDGTVEEVEVPKPFTPKRYMEAIRLACESGDYDVLIIDGISPEWDDVGGCLQTVDELKRKYSGENEKAATRNAWSIVTPQHKDFINLILRTKMHVICTMLARKEEVVVKDENGRIIDRKKTLEPIQRDGIEKIFDIFAKMEERDMLIDKTRCSELEGQVYHKPGQEVADIIREWLKGEPMLDHPEYIPETLQNAQKLEEVKAYFLKVYKDEAKWEGLKAHCLLFPMPDESLGDAELAKLHEEISKAETEIERRKASAKQTQPPEQAQPETPATPTQPNEQPASATEQQYASLRKLCQHLSKPEPETGLSYQSAKELILNLSREYNESRQNKKSA